MAKNIPSPYLATPPERIRAVGDQPNHTLYSLEEEPVIIPLQFTVTAGVLDTQKVTNLCFAESQGAGVVRIYHPYVQSTGLHVFFSRSAGSSYTVDQSTADQGYFDITFPGATTGSFEGYIVGRGSKDVGDISTVTGEAWEHRTLAERHQDRVVSPVPGCCVFLTSFLVDGSGDPQPATGRGTLAFNVSHTGVGTYTVSTTVEMNDSWTFIAQANGILMDASLGTPGNEINLVATADPGLDAEIVVLAIGPRGRDGKSVVNDENAIAPRTQHIRTGTYPACGLQRDSSFIPIQFAVDGAGEILVDDPNTVIPNNVSITKVGITYIINFGATHEALTVASFHSSSSAGSFGIDYINVPNGSLEFAESLASTVVRGYILGCWTSER